MVDFIEKKKNISSKKKKKNSVLDCIDLGIIWYL